MGDQDCERVTMCCGRLEDDSRRAWCGTCYQSDWKCAYHGIPWPDGEKECPAWKQWVGDCLEDSVP